MASAPNFEQAAPQKGTSNPTITWNEQSFSYSTNAVLKKVLAINEANLIEALAFLIEAHPEYGTGEKQRSSRNAKAAPGPFQQLLEFLQQNERSLKLPALKAVEWANLLLSVFNTPKGKEVLHGRAFLIAAILENYQSISLQLKNNPTWVSICKAIIEAVGEETIKDHQIQLPYLLTQKGQQLYAQYLNPNAENAEEILEESIIDTNNLSDGPAKEDSLSRTALAKYLAKRLRHIYNRDIDQGKYGSFFMHIDGAWGSGKSTLLGFLEAELKSGEPYNSASKKSKLADGKWVVVNFNAWENQRLNPPWWFLMKTVHNEAVKSLKESAKTKAQNPYAKQDRAKVRKLILNDFLWRYNTGRNYLWVSVITLLLFVALLVIGANTEDKFNKLPIVQLVTFVGFLWSLFKGFGTSLASGSAKAAQNFIQENGKDPLQIIADHFKEQINHIGYPVAIFIDDLDRCNKDYGIQLLEGLQTIFKKAGVVYVIAADRKWLSTMYKHQYEMFAPIIEKPAKPFGMIFLDKIFQLIVELPDISSVQKKIYWDNLLNVSNKEKPDEMKQEKAELQQKLTHATTNAQMMEIANRSANSPAMEQVAREVALSEFSIREEEKILEHKLQHFVDLIEPNPRAMKRLINDISTARAIAFLYKQEVEEDQLIIWTILKLRHPLLAEFFWNNPHKMDEVALYSDINIAFTGNKAFDQLILDEEIKKLCAYAIGEKKVDLNTAFIRKLKFQELENKKSQRKA